MALVISQNKHKQESCAVTTFCKAIAWCHMLFTTPLLHPELCENPLTTQ